LRSIEAARSARYESVLVVLAFTLRAIVACAALRSHAPQWFFAQASELGCLAESLCTGHGFSSPFGGATGPSAFLAPGYPALIAAIFHFFGSFTQASEIAIMLLQVLFGTLTVLMILRVTSALFSQRAALLAGVAATFSPPLLFVPTIFWETSFSICFSACVLWLVVCGDLANKPHRWAWMALITVVGAAVNPSLLTIVVPMWCVAWRQGSPRSIKPQMIATALCILVLALWPARNWRAMHAFIPARTNLGYELWQGNRPGSNGFFSAQLHPNTNTAEFHRYAEMRELAYMQEKSSIAKQAIAANPMRFLGITAKRFGCFWTGFGMTTSVITLIYTLAGTVLGFAGLLRLCRRSPRLASLFGLPLVLFPLPYYITHPDLRFRLVLDPILLALAAYAVTSRDHAKGRVGRS
jgi:4-amino-4-deoxy-L-arabinose transferase-like glycosyltransferase